MQNKYDLIFDAYQEDPSLDDSEFCRKHGFTEQEISDFWTGDMPNPATKEIEVVKKYSRDFINRYRKQWNDLGLNPKTLVNYAERFFGMPHDKWSFKAWMMFANELSDPNNPKYSIFIKNDESFDEYVNRVEG